MFVGILTATHRSFVQNWSSQTCCKYKTFPAEEKQQLFCLLSLLKVDAAQCVKKESVLFRMKHIIRSDLKIQLFNPSPVLQDSKGANAACWLILYLLHQTQLGELCQQLGTDQVTGSMSETGFLFRKWVKPDIAKIADTYP